MMGSCGDCEYLTSRHNCKKYKKALSYISLSSKSLSTSEHERCSECNKDFYIKYLEAELAGYREAEQDGRLLVLPCKIGDTVYLTHYAKDRSGWITSSTCAGIHITDKVSRYFRDKPCKYLVIRNNSCGFSNHVQLSKIGKTAFFTREEAETALSKEAANDE